jgi:pimeloyl-ACP methyl ester carboxylesterase
LVESALPLVASVPALLLWGDRDLAVDPASAAELHRRWGNSVVVTMKGVGHVPYEEVPSEFNRIALDFLLSDVPPLTLRYEPQAEMPYVAPVAQRA